MYLNLKNSNAVDKSFCAVITGMITYTIYMKLQKYIHYQQEDPADPSAFPILPNLPTSQVFRHPKPPKFANLTDL
jgi:hypothetical protein